MSLRPKRPRAEVYPVTVPVNALNTFFFTINVILRCQCYELIISTNILIPDDFAIMDTQWTNQYIHLVFQCSNENLNHLIQMNEPIGS